LRSHGTEVERGVRAGVDAAARGGMSAVTPIATARSAAPLLQIAPGLQRLHVDKEQSGVCGYPHLRQLGRKHSPVD
jgi:hypothetical protein